MEANNAKLREALEQFVDCWDNCNYAEMGKQLVEQARAALSSPPRNCDVGTAEEQAERFDKFCEYTSCQKCNANRIGFQDCRFVWENMPYQEGGAK